MDIFQRMALITVAFISVAAIHIDAYASNESGGSNYTPSLVGHYLSGGYAARNQDTETAAKIYLKALKNTPDNPTVLYNSYSLMLLMGKVDKAAEIARKYSEVVSANSDINILLAVQAIKDNKFDVAEEILNISTKHEKITVSSSINRVISPFLKLWVKIGQGKNEEAIEFLNDKISSSKAPSLFTHYQKALVSDMLGNKEEAAKNFAHVSQGDTILPYHFVKLAGNFYERVGKTENAKLLYNTYQVKFPQAGYFRHDLERINDGDEPPRPLVTNARQGFAEVLEEATRVLMNSGYYEDGLPYLRLAMFLKADNDETKMLLASSFENAKQYKKAVKIYKDIDEDSDFYLASRIAIAENLYSYGKKDKAIRHLVSITNYDNPSNVALLTLADFYRKEKQFANAVEIYTKVIDKLENLTMKNWPIFFARGICNERAKRWEAAEKDLQKALELKPNQPEVLNYLGYSWIDRDENIEEAKKMVQIAVKARPDDPQIIDSMGWALFKISEYDEASVYLEKAAEITPYDATINDHLGDVYWRQGRRNEAIFQWERAIKYNNSDDLSETEVRDKIQNGLPELNDKS